MNGFRATFGLVELSAFWIAVASGESWTSERERSCESQAATSQCQPDRNSPRAPSNARKNTVSNG